MVGIKTGPLTIQFKPEHHFSENKEFDGFWELLRIRGTFFH